MSRNINVRIADDQENDIKKSGMKISEYTRHALDDFSIRRHNSLLQLRINMVQDCIDRLVDYKRELQEQMIDESYKVLYENEKNVKKSEEKSLYNTGENVKKIYKDDEISLQNVKTNTDEPLYNNEQNVKTMSEHPLYYKYRPYIKTLSKLLNLHGNIPEDTKKKITSETATNMPEISNFIYDFRNEIKHQEWSMSDERIVSDYDDGRPLKKK